jgi:hypothetical protein
MTPAATRNIRILLARVSYDIVADATSDMGVAKIAGTGEVAETGEALGAVDLTFWGATPAELRARARTWPERFDAVQGEHFGVSDAGEHRFDIFLSAERFFRLLDLAHGSRRASIRLSCDLSEDGTLDLVREMEISASRG